MMTPRTTSPITRFRHTLQRLHPCLGCGESNRRTLTQTCAAALVALQFLTLPVQADPFRARDPRPIDDTTERAFLELFKEGDYAEARQILQNPTPNEPLAYALRASLSYLYGDLDGLQTNATETLRTAEQLKQTDALRGNLYIAAGHFLQGAHTFSTAENQVAAAPAVLAKLQQVFSALNAAERISPNDPELNLLRGYMDLMLAVNLPFADPNAAIQRLRQHGAPDYLVQRGLAIGYRDLRRNEEALRAVNEALRAAPNNPDLYYLKAQILVRQGKHQEAMPQFRQALEKRQQLPPSLVGQIVYENCRAEARINGIAEGSPQDAQNRQECLSQRDRP